jgi:hypothetical protein
VSLGGDATGAALVLAFVLSFSNPGGSFYERNFVWLFWVNVVAACCWRWSWWWWRCGWPCGCCAASSAAGCSSSWPASSPLVGLLPGLVIYTVSYQFVSRSIEAWFDVKVAGALDAGLALGKGTLEALAADLVGKTRVAAERWPTAAWPWCRWRWSALREQIGANEASLVTASGQVLLTAGGRPPPARPSGPALPCCARRKQLGTASQVEGLDDESLAPTPPARDMRALARVPRNAVLLAAGEERFLMVVQPIRARWPSTRWRCRPPTANTSSARWAATACAACTSAP